MSTCLVGIFFVGFGIHIGVDAAHRDGTYVRLRDHGVRLNARFEGCGRPLRPEQPG